MSDNEPKSFGRVDEQGNVYVKTDAGERLVGQYPDATAEEALAYFVRKYHDLEAQVRLLEQRVITGAKANTISSALDPLLDTISAANAVGDLGALSSRLTTLKDKVAALAQEQKAHSEQALAEAASYRESLVVQIEALAAKDPQKLQWKQTTAEINRLFDQWKNHQQTGPRIPKEIADGLWERFRKARNELEVARRAFFAQLDATHKSAKQAKQEIVKEAEALADSGKPAVAEYRELLDRWKKSGRAGAKVDDALWEEFKAAGDRIYAVKNEELARENEEYSANLVVKRELLAEAEAILPVTDHQQARAQLTAILTKWDAVGKVPRDQMRSVEDRIGKVERAVRKAEDDHWRVNNPETKARVDGLASQLDDAIAQLEGELTEATAAGQSQKISELTEALEARKAWRSALG